MIYLKNILRKLNKRIEIKMKENIKNQKLIFSKTLLQTIFQKMLEITKKLF